MHRILIVEDHPIFRQGLSTLLSSEPDIEVIGEAESGEEAIRFAEEHLPDLVVVDLSLPNMHGVEVIREIKRLSPTTRILTLTVHSDEQFVIAALKAGADGYILKEADGEEILTAVRTVAGGQSYLSPTVSDTVIQGLLKRTKPSHEPTSDVDLSKREQEVLTLIAQGHTNKEIADLLGLSVKTVEKHRANIKAKLHLHNTQALTSYAIRKGLIQN